LKVRIRCIFPKPKVFTACCSLRPAVLLANSDVVPEFLISCRALRGGSSIFEETISTRQMHRTFGELVRYLGLYNNLPRTTILLTGTGIVPADDFSLREGGSGAIFSLQ
jgi:2-dehydro-3-deoxy-D-arabinonate dehydratase